MMSHWRWANGMKLGIIPVWWEGICLGWNHPTLGRFQLLGRFQEKYCFSYSKWADSCPVGRFQPRQFSTQMVLISRVPDSINWFQLISPSSQLVWLIVLQYVSTMNYLGLASYCTSSSHISVFVAQAINNSWFASLHESASFRLLF